MANTALYNLLVVDDDSLITDSLRLLLPKHWRMTALKNPALIDSKMLYHAAMVDMHLTSNHDEAEGPEIIATLSRTNPQIEIVAMSGDLSLDLMERCLKNGAQKFLAKPLMPDEVLATLEKIEAVWMMRLLEGRHHLPAIQWVGQSPQSLEVKKTIASFRGEAGPILIEGETGTGKEVVFRILNQQEQTRPFVTVNIAGIPENLFESEMFGHVRGAFTGADQMKIGLAEAAHGGDLFLDEIEALPMTQQVKLLRFLETGEVRKVGAKESTNVKARVICASNQSLTELVKQGKFREDLLFRISGKKIFLPPLRDRIQDIKELAQLFLNQQKPRTNKALSPEAITALQKYGWPGNVRELKRICEQMALTSPLPIIRAEDIEHLLSPRHGAEGSSAWIDLKKGLPKLIEEFEARVIQKCLEQSPDMETAIQTLQVSRSSLYKKIKDYQIDTGSKE
jgi:DNA-binding NtrC family response regulator